MKPMRVVRISEDQIRARAYQLFLQRGGQPGYEVDDWLQAEYELMQLPVAKLAKLAPPLSVAKSARKSLVTVVQAALLLSAGMLPHWR